MKHSVTFRNRDNTWDNALPIGNGVFGAMLFFEDGKLNMPMNHYEVYYNIKAGVLPSDSYDDCEKELAYAATLTDAERKERYGKAWQEQRELADANIPPAGEPFCEYRLGREPALNATSYDMLYFTSSYPPTGELVYNFCDCLKDAEQELILHVEDAEVNFRLCKDRKEIAMRTIVARPDCVINKVTQSQHGLLKSIRMDFAPSRNRKAPEPVFTQIDDSTFAYTISRRMMGQDNPFVFSGILKLVGATGKLSAQTQFADIDIVESDEEFYILAGVFTDWRYEDTLHEGLELVDRWSKDISALEAEHAAYWKAFFDRMSISLPDTFLEHVYYVNQYALDACSGRDGIMKHQACGLNGLWDVRHPVLWGSKWYWDVNIQASFAGVFTGNRLELGKVFSDGLLTYIKLAEKFALEKHNLPGAALDYPYVAYYCIMPWCAQYMWYQYEYSMDKEYLRKDAYPVFLKLAEFAVNRFAYDEKRDEYYIYPDISPEQGPLAHNTTITVACVKYLLNFTLEAAEILGDNAPILEKVREMYAKMPDYKISGDGFWGKHIMDSWDAHENMWIRHPSLLMPLYPIGEYDPLTADDETKQILSNSVDYLEDQTELGVFQCSWIAAAAARLGRGNAALRILYEKGLDHLLRSNGLTAEETDHFINFCLATRQPLYYPCMMEFTGEMLAAVQEMLLQSYNGVMRVFAAVPNKEREWGHFMRHGRSLQEYPDRHVDYKPWKDVRFDRLLAKGAFEVTAELKDEKLKFILVTSKAGGTAKITSPYLTEAFSVFCDGKHVAATWENGILSFETEAGKSYVVATSIDVDTTQPSDGDYADEILCRESFAKRHIYIGENTDTGYHKALDQAIRDWYIGNSRQSNHTVYKFDFGSNEQKDYKSTLTRQVYVDAAKTLKHLPFVPIHEENMAFTSWNGYGLSNVTGVSAKERDMDDCIRRDFLEGTEPTEFIVETPRGQYEFFVVSGDKDEDSVTILEGLHGFKVGGDLVKKGTWQCEIVPMVKKKDNEHMRLKVSTVPGKKWKLNLIVVNAIKGF